MIVDFPEESRLKESISLFREVVQGKWLRDSFIILFLNRVDVFKEKIKEIPLNSVADFSDYKVTIATAEYYNMLRELHTLKLYNI